MTAKRQIVLDTETTGIGHESGHRLIEIGCAELNDRRLSKNNYHVYLNPQRAVDEGAFKVHGLSNEFLNDKPLFNEIYTDFLKFVEGAELIIHNAAFDVGFINAELKRIGHGKKLEDYCSILDTLDLARKLHPGQKNNLDILCKRYQIDSSDRVFHGALLDAELLAEVYIAMTSGQKKMDFNEPSVQDVATKVQTILSSKSPVIYATASEKLAHEQFLTMIEKKASKVVWKTIVEE